MRVNRVTGDIQARSVELSVDESDYVAACGSISPNLMSRNDEAEAVLEQVLGIEIDGVGWVMVQRCLEDRSVKIKLGSIDE